MKFGTIISDSSGLNNKRGDFIMVKKRVVSKKSVAKKSAQRKAPAATKKRSVRKKAAASVSPLVSAQNDLRKAKAQIEKLTLKEISQSEKRVERIKGQIVKAQAAQDKVRQRRQAAAEKLAAKPTAASKRAVINAREASRLATEKMRGLRAELKTAKEALSTAKLAQKKRDAKAKVLAKFEKDWEKAQNRPRKRISKKRVAKKAASKS